MTITEANYFSIRSNLLHKEQSKILAIEQKYMQFLLDVLLSAASTIYYDFSQAMELKPFWVNYSPVQRGRSPRGTSIPWGEVGEKTISASLIRAISLKEPSITYPGLPLGGDIRFAADDALIHLDIKLTGPNDNPDEIVASPHQVSGDGLFWQNGVFNSPVKVAGSKAEMNFQPELPPFYVLDNRILLCLTYFIKAVYIVKDLGIQPLHYFELVSVPNGLLLFDGPNYAQTRGLFIPGKDIRKHPKKRTRIRLAPLATLDDWRCIKIEQIDTEWCAMTRSNISQLPHPPIA
ncbi:MAG TPA: BglI family type II restriction endonuclease [Ktedonobacteraceae bacterium]|jgi:hypothetical protein|nr:BglI family type II restriction endonuclease [Ktedonobacteraceae bacterium]